MLLQQGGGQALVSIFLNRKIASQSKLEAVSRAAERWMATGEGVRYQEFEDRSGAGRKNPFPTGPLEGETTSSPRYRLAALLTQRRMPLAQTAPHLGESASMLSMYLHGRASGDLAERLDKAVVDWLDHGVSHKLDPNVGAERRRTQAERDEEYTASGRRKRTRKAPTRLGANGRGEEADDDVGGVRVLFEVNAINAGDHVALSIGEDKFRATLQENGLLVPADADESDSGLTLTDFYLWCCRSAAARAAAENREAPTIPTVAEAQHKAWRQIEYRGQAFRKLLAGYCGQQPPSDAGTGARKPSFADDALSTLSGPSSSRQGMRTVTVAQMVRDGALQPGPGVLTMRYKTHQVYADLLANGKMVYNGHEWESVSKMAVQMVSDACKVLGISSSRTAFNGWLLVFYKGEKLRDVRDNFYGVDGRGSGGGGGSRSGDKPLLTSITPTLKRERPPLGTTVSTGFVQPLPQPPEWLLRGLRDHLSELPVLQEPRLDKAGDEELSRSVATAAMETLSRWRVLSERTTDEGLLQSAEELQSLIETARIPGATPQARKLLAHFVTEVRAAGALSDALRQNRAKFDTRVNTAVAWPADNSSAGFFAGGGGGGAASRVLSARGRGTVLERGHGQDGTSGGAGGHQPRRLLELNGTPARPPVLVPESSFDERGPFFDRTDKVEPNLYQMRRLAAPQSLRAAREWANRAEKVTNGAEDDGNDGLPTIVDTTLQLADLVPSVVDAATGDEMRLTKLRSRVGDVAGDADGTGVLSLVDTRIDKARARLHRSAKRADAAVLERHREALRARSVVETAMKKRAAALEAFRAAAEEAEQAASAAMTAGTRYLQASRERRAKRRKAREDFLRSVSDARTEAAAAPLIRGADAYRKLVMEWITSGALVECVPTLCGRVLADMGEWVRRANDLVPVIDSATDLNAKQGALLAFLQLRRRCRGAADALRLALARWPQGLDAADLRSQLESAIDESTKLVDLIQQPAEAARLHGDEIMSLQPSLRPPMSYVGTRVVRRFERVGDFVGEVVQVMAASEGADKAGKFRVRYTDGDEEHMPRTQLETLLLYSAAPSTVDALVAARSVLQSQSAQSEGVRLELPRSRHRFRGRTLVLSHASCVGHSVPERHPEAVARMLTCVKALRQLRTSLVGINKSDAADSGLDLDVFHFAHSDDRDAEMREVATGEVQIQQPKEEEEPPEDDEPEHDPAPTPDPEPESPSAGGGAGAGVADLVAHTDLGEVAAGVAIDTSQMAAPAIVNVAPAVSGRSVDDVGGVPAPHTYSIAAAAVVDVAPAVVGAPVAHSSTNGASAEPARTPVAGPPQPSSKDPDPTLQYQPRLPSRLVLRLAHADEHLRALVDACDQASAKNAATRQRVELLKWHAKNDVLLMPFDRAADTTSSESSSSDEEGRRARRRLSRHAAPMQTATATGLGVGGAGGAMTDVHGREGQEGKGLTEKPFNPMDHSDTFISKDSFRAAMAASSCVVEAVDRVIYGSIAAGAPAKAGAADVDMGEAPPVEAADDHWPLDADKCGGEGLGGLTGAHNALCIVRPPGHHAGRRGKTRGAPSCGFCLLNSAAIGALHALHEHPETIGRVAIVDIDVHFGNGTAEIVRDFPNIFFGSMHMRVNGDSGCGDFFPGKRSGDPDDTPNFVSVVLAPGDTEANSSAANGGAPAAKRARIDPPLGVGGGGVATRASQERRLKGREGFRAALLHQILPRLYAFKPDLLIVSAGFDGMATDPVGYKLGLKESDVHWATTQLVAAAERLCHGRLVSVLEGGYDLWAGGLANAVVAHTRALTGRPLPPSGM